MKNNFFNFRKLLVSIPLTFFINNAVFASGYQCDLTTFDGSNSQLRIIPTGNKYAVIFEKDSLGNFRVIDNSINFLHIFNSFEKEKMSMHIGINKKTKELIFNLMDFKITNRPASQVNGSCQKSN